MDYKKKWQVIKELGAGGQGKVYKVLDREQYEPVRNDFIKQFRDFANPQVTVQKHLLELFEHLQKSFADLRRVGSNFGALKVLNKPEHAVNPDSAQARMKNEIQAMSQNLHHNLIEIIAVDPDDEWFVSQFYPNGTLADNPELFKGDFLAALKALRPLVEAVDLLHEKGIVHRDIKPENIFLNSNHELILDDLGIVFCEDKDHSRLTNSFENVGSRDWMPFWAQAARVEDVNSKFDVFSLGKVLWSMVSRLPRLHGWYYTKQRYNLEDLFPENPYMNIANQFFAKCIVEEESQCEMEDAKGFLAEIDRIVVLIQQNAGMVGFDIVRSCQVCGRGEYELLTARYKHESHSISDNMNLGLDPKRSRRYLIFACKNCGHAQLFYYTRDTLPLAWRNN